jgi:hypothetical protein
LLAQTVAEGINLLATPVCYNSTARQTSLKPESENCPLNVAGRGANRREREHGLGFMYFSKAHTGRELVTAGARNFSINKEKDAARFQRFDLSPG